MTAVLFPASLGFVLGCVIVGACWMLTAELARDRQQREKAERQRHLKEFYERERARSAHREDVT